MASGAIRLELFQLGASIPNFSDRQGSLVFEPGGRSCQRMIEPRYMSPPIAKVEVKVATAVPHRLGNRRTDQQERGQEQGNTSFHKGLRSLGMTLLNLNSRRFSIRSKYR